MVCDGCKGKTFSLNQFLGKMLYDKWYDGMINTNQIPSISF
jgi:hypothetical protein